MKTKIKICGLTKVDDVTYALEQGADFIGLIFVPNHPTTVDENNAAEILEVIKKKKGKSVALFQNQDLYMVQNMIKKYSFDFVQLHGNESIEYGKQIRIIAPIMKVFSIGNAVPIESALTSIQSYENVFEYVILDRVAQGKGKMVDVALAREVCQKYPTFIAGGLTAENVSDIVKTVETFGVDVSSGVRTNGEADYEKIKQFITKVKLSSRT